MKRKDDNNNTDQEDQKLINNIKTDDHGEGVKRHCGKSCRMRWLMYLKRRSFSLEEEDLIIKLHALLGDRWSLIAGRLPGRTDSEIKTYWNSHMKEKLRNAGIDPNNHRVDQTLITTSSKNPNIYEDTKLFISRKEPSKNLFESRSSNGNEDNNDDGNEEEGKKLVGPSSTDELNLDLTIAFPSSSSSSLPYFLGLEKKKQQLQEDSDEFRADVSEAQNQLETPTLLLFK